MLISSKVISRPESVTADLILRMLIAGSSSSSMMPVGEDSDLLIFDARLGKISNSADRGQDVRLRNDERLAVAGVEAYSEVTGELEMLPLVLPDGYLIGLVQQDVGSHQHRIGEQAHIRGLRPHLGGLVLELRHPLGLSEAGQAAQHPAELGVFGNCDCRNTVAFAGSIPAASSCAALRSVRSRSTAGGSGR